MMAFVDTFPTQNAFFISNDVLNHLIQAVQLERLEDVKEFILYVIYHCNAHTSGSIGRFTGREYQHVTMKQLCGKKLTTILYEMKTEDSIYKDSKKRTWHLVDKDHVINDGRQYHSINKVVFPSNQQLKWREKQMGLGKSCKQYEALCCEYSAIADTYAPLISLRCGKKRWQGRYKKWRRLLHRLYENHMNINSILINTDTDANAEINTELA
eukprot:555620_1